MIIKNQDTRPSKSMHEKLKTSILHIIHCGASFSEKYLAKTFSSNHRKRETICNNMWVLILR